MATILTKKKDTTGAPVAGDLTNSSGGAELAVNTADKRLYTKDSGGNVVEVGTNPGTAVTFTAGTVSAPAITTTGDTNTGVFFPAADTIAFAEGGAEAMRINSDSQVVTTAGTASLPAITTTGDVNTGIFFPAADTIAFGEGGAEVMRIDSSGNVGIGTSSPTQRLDVVAANSQIHFGAATTGGGYLMSTANGQFRISGGAVWDGSNWIAKSTTASIIGDDATGDIKFLSNTSLTAGNSFTPTERMRIDSSGNVGIGSTSPSTFDDANGGRNLVLQSTGTQRGVITFASQQTSGADNVLGIINFIDSDSTNTAYRGARILGMLGSDANSAYLRFDTANSAAGTERARITSGGNFYVGTTSNTNFFSSEYCFDRRASQNESTIAARQPDNSGGYNYRSIAANNGGTYYHMTFDEATTQTRGSITSNGSAVAYNTTSDYRLKENIVPMTGALATVAQLNPVTYTWKADGSVGQGFIAHELQAVVPDCVTGEKDATEMRQVEVSPAVEATYDEDGNELTPAVEATYEEREVPKYQGVDTSFLVAILTAAIQELKAITDAQATRIEALEAEVAAMKAKA